MKFLQFLEVIRIIWQHKSSKRREKYEEGNMRRKGERERRNTPEPRSVKAILAIRVEIGSFLCRVKRARPLACRPDR